MKTEEACQLIASAEITRNTPQHWLDLGCGTGTFTLALAQLLPPHSHITGIDLDIQLLPGEAGDKVRIDFKQGDLQDIKIRETLDGILMANSLHYVKDQISFLEKLSQITQHLILVEYDTNRSNAWVPYPVSFAALKTIVPQGSDLKKIGKMQSMYQGGGLYAAEVWLKKDAPFISS